MGRRIQGKTIKGKAEMTKRNRDFQKQAVYNSENIACDLTGTNNGRCEFGRLDECKLFAEKIINSKYWQAQKGWKRIKLKDGRGRRAACYDDQDKSVSLPMWSRNKVVIIHEFAHYLTHKTTEDATGHGSHFCGHFLALLDELVGMEASMALMEQFEKHKVIYHLR